MHKINFKIQRLYKQRKRKVLSISFLVILILFDLLILIYDFIKIKEFDAIILLLIIPLLVGLISEINNINKINKELKKENLIYHKNN